MGASIYCPTEQIFIVIDQRTWHLYITPSDPFAPFRMARGQKNSELRRIGWRRRKRKVPFGATYMRPTIKNRQHRPRMA